MLCSRWNLMPSFGLHGYCMQMVPKHTYIRTDKTLTHVKKKKRKKSCLVAVSTLEWSRGVEEAKGGYSCIRRWASWSVFCCRTHPDLRMSSTTRLLLCLSTAETRGREAASQSENYFHTLGWVAVMRRCGAWGTVKWQMFELQPSHSLCRFFWFTQHFNVLLFFSESVYKATWTMQ